MVHPSDVVDAFTHVLRGHIALAMAHFECGASGQQLDGIARSPLWSAGLQFAHGTGHGVGHVLSVHEGPASISKRGAVAIEAGMVLSNEPVITGRITMGSGWKIWLWRATHLIQVFCVLKH